MKYKRSKNLNRGYCSFSIAEKTPLIFWDFDLIIYK